VVGLLAAGSPSVTLSTGGFRSAALFLVGLALLVIVAVPMTVAFPRVAPCCHR